MYVERGVKNSHILVDHDSVIPASPLRGKIDYLSQALSDTV
jgi:hypothetical protein